MSSGKCWSLAELPSEVAAILTDARRGVLATIDPDGSPHCVPVVYIVREHDVVSPIDDKPKSGPELRRVRNLAADPRATLLVDRWAEDWERIGWVMVRSLAHLITANPVADELRRRYPQYDEHITPGERALVLEPQTITWWTWSD